MIDESTYSEREKEIHMHAYTLGVQDTLKTIKELLNKHPELKIEMRAEGYGESTQNTLYRGDDASLAEDRIILPKI